MIIDELIAILGYDLKGEENLARFNSGLERAAVLAGRLSVAIVAAGTIAAGALAALGKGVINTSAQFEGFETSLETIEGSASKAKDDMAWITTFAQKTPYELAGVTEAFIKLKSYGFDPMNGTLTTLGDTASAMNKPLDQAVEAFADAATFQFERLKEFGITSSQKGDEVTFSWTKNGKKLSKVVQKNSEEVSKFLLDHFGSAFNGAMDRQSKTWNGMMSNLQDSWSNFKHMIGDAGFFDVAKTGLSDLLNYIGKLGNDGTLKRWAKNLSDVLSFGFRALSTVFERVIKDAGTVIDLIDSLGGKIADFLRYISGGSIDLGNWQALVAVFGGLVAVLNPAWVAAAGLALAIDDFLTYLRGGKSIIGDMIAEIEKLVPSAQKAISDLGSAVANMDWAAAGKTIGSAIVNAAGDAIKSIGNLISQVDWGDLGRRIGSSINFKAIGEMWFAAMKGSLDLIRGLFEGLIDGLIHLDWAAIGRAWLAGWKAQIDLFNGIIAGLGDSIIAAVKGWFADVDFSALGKSIVDGIIAALVALPAAIIALLTGGDYSQIGRKIGEGILAGLQSIGGEIKEWFAGLLPEWASDFFSFKETKDGSLKGKAGEVGDRRKQMEQLLTPANQNTPGIQELFQNLQGNTAKTGANTAIQNVVNDNSDRSISVTPNVQVSVQQIQAAASATGQKTADAVKTALSNVNNSNPPSRVMHGAHF